MPALLMVCICKRVILTEALGRTWLQLMETPDCTGAIMAPLTRLCFWAGTCPETP